MAHMQMQIYKKGATYTAECRKCGATLWSHEWYHVDNNYRRDAMQDGTLCCDDCDGTADPETFRKERAHYAGLYSAPGYLDRTDVHYGTNRREFERELRDCYGE